MGASTAWHRLLGPFAFSTLSLSTRCAFRECIRLLIFAEVLPVLIALWHR
jgi:hypothetical protein